MPERRRLRRAVAAGLAGVTAYDLLQRRHAILRNFPVVGHLRYLLELFGPELRQYIVTSNDEERPFSRDQRRWVYASAKSQTNTFAFGTDNETESVGGMLAIKHAPFPVAPPDDRMPGGFPDYAIPAGKVLGGARGRRHAFRPASLVNVSGMSFGALSGPAVQALNAGARSPAACTAPARAGCRRITATAASSSSRSAPATSAAATRRGASRCPSCRRRSPATRCGRSRSSSRKARSRASAGCCRARR